MKQGIIKKNDLGSFIESLKSDNRVYGPVKQGNTISLEEISSIEDLHLDYFNLKQSLKSFFSPQSEVIYMYKDDSVNDSFPSEQRAVVFGPRPCDTRALVSLDKVYSGDIEDPYYLARRENIIVISRICKDPLDTCFCTSVGGSPSGEEGSDILTCDINESLLFEGITERGQGLMETHAASFQQPKKADLKARDDLIKESEKKLSKIDVNGISERLDSIFDDAFWDKIHQTCLGCGICTYLCPTCHCFAIYDEGFDADQGERIRCWDSCQYPTFTLEASAHNPRVSGRERLRQRIMHKFSYFVKNNGEIACVGCGRCVENCPVNLDLREIIARIREVS